MSTDDTDGAFERQSTTRRRAPRSAFLVVVLAALAVGAAACGGGGARLAGPSPSGSPPSSSVGPTTTTTPTGPGGSGFPGSLPVRSRGLAFAKCMRAHGVHTFADPPAPGSLPAGNKTTYLGDGFDPNAPAVQAAEQACRKYAVGLASPVTPAGAAQVRAQMLEYATCMRAHGEPDFPDPSAQGGFAIPGSIDQNSAGFEATQRACKSFLPGVPGRSGSSPP
jgi:hypothetical protein